MIEVMNEIERWRLSGRRVAVARVVGIEGSGPRDPGATLAVSKTLHDNVIRTGLNYHF